MHLSWVNQMSYGSHVLGGRTSTQNASSDWPYWKIPIDALSIPYRYIIDSSYAPPAFIRIGKLLATRSSLQFNNPTRIGQLPKHNGEFNGGKYTKERIILLPGPVRSSRRINSAV
jgi:hypothetical protein